MFSKINNYEKTNKKGGKKKEGNLPNGFEFLKFWIKFFLDTMKVKIYRKTKLWEYKGFSYLKNGF